MQDSTARGAVLVLRPQRRTAQERSQHSGEGRGVRSKDSPGGKWARVTVTAGEHAQEPQTWGCGGEGATCSPSSLLPALTNRAASRTAVWTGRGPGQ